ncbi:hypothetical protein CDD83_2214 [Cordyceps sp. RAO-2017]|nr:hypothetical protein CDD83_2214 [Cordyceps sp. RAO-2017]
MATPQRIHVSARDTGLLRVEQDDAAAAKVTELLQKDLEQNHVFFNDEGFHNHISHHLLTLYGTGAAPAALEQAFAGNESYQIRALASSDEVVAALEADWPGNAPRYLGRGRHYPDFLRYFQRQMDGHGGRWQPVVERHLLPAAGDDAGGPWAAARYDLLGRLYAGFLHPLIQLMRPCTRAASAT